MRPEKLYDNVAGIYDKRHDSPSSLWLRRHEDTIVRKLKGRTIDIGCGTGHDLALLDDVVGIDPSEEMLKIAGKTGKRVMLGKAEKLPFPDASFDNAVCLFCVLNMCDCKKAVVEMSRVLKPGGSAVISVASVWDRGYGISKRFGVKHPAKEKTITIDGNKTKLVLFEKNELVELFRKHGLKLAKFVSLFKFQKPLWGNWNPLAFWSRLKLHLDAVPIFGDYGAMYIMVFRKI